MFSVFLSSYKNTCESSGDLEKAVEILPCQLKFHRIPHFPIIHLSFCNSMKILNVFMHFLHADIAKLNVWFGTYTDLYWLITPNKSSSFGIFLQSNSRLPKS